MKILTFAFSILAIVFVGLFAVKHNPFMLIWAIAFIAAAMYCCPDDKQPPQNYSSFKL